MTWRVAIYDNDVRESKKHATLPDYVSLCNWIRVEVKGEGVNVHVTAPQDATIDQLQELRRLGVRVTV
ncbi:hypothetical protein [Bradyrhizobium genosp. P]|uniref:hypothetical protein n=1 Tax=Bradyrhizobium genosp. P TaxID=83641 RepID=UPI003CE9DB92